MMDQDLKRIKEIWHVNTTWQNICWIGDILFLCVILPFYIVKELLWGEK